MIAYMLIMSNVFIYLEEDKEGCTGTKRFHNLLNKQ